MLKEGGKKSIWLNSEVIYTIWPIVCGDHSRLLGSGVSATPIATRFLKSNAKAYNLLSHKHMLAVEY